MGCADHTPGARACNAVYVDAFFPKHPENADMGKTERGASAEGKSDSDAHPRKIPAAAEDSQGSPVMVRATNAFLLPSRRGLPTLTA